MPPVPCTPLAGKTTGHFRSRVGGKARGQFGISRAASEHHLAIFGLDADVAALAIIAAGDLVVRRLAGFGVGVGAAGHLAFRIRTAGSKQQGAGGHG
jgi:hypothetical protein